MASSGDIETAIVNKLVEASYPTGAPSVLGTISIERGWPTEADLRTATSKKAALIRVHAVPGMARDSTATLRRWDVLQQDASTITASVSGNVVTLVGAVTAGNTVGLLVNGVAVTQVAKATDTLSTMAAALAGQISSATASGAVITCPSAPQVSSVNGGTAILQVSRLDQVFNVVLWTPSPATRDQILAVIEPALKYDVRYPMPDGTTAMLLNMQASGPMDAPSRANAWKQTVSLRFRYITAYVQNQQAMAAGIQNFTPTDGTAVTVEVV